MAKPAPWQPSENEVVRVMFEQSPWQRSGAVPGELLHQVPRPLARHLWKRVCDNDPARFHLLLGPRRVGKSTVMYQTVQRLLKHVPTNRVWRMSLDHPSLSEESLGDLVNVIREATYATADSPVYCFLDEITYAKDWDRWLKTFYDDRWPVRIVASSSSVAALRRKRTESGVGRWDEHEVAPYSFREYLQLSGIEPALPTGENLWLQISACVAGAPPIVDYDSRRRKLLLAGGFPEILFADLAAPASEDTLAIRSQERLRQDAIQKAIYQDIPQAVGLHAPRELERLLYVLAGQTAGLLSPSNITSSVGISVPTLERYLSFLEQSFLVFTLPNYSTTEEARQRRGRKLYFVDGAVRNAALQRGSLPLSDPRELGMLIENLAAAELHALGRQTSTRIYHWRDGDHEVDLVYDHATDPIAFEITTSAKHRTGGLLEFQRRFPRFEGRTFVVSVSASVRAPDPTSSTPGSLPLDLFLLICGEQAERGLLSRVGLVAPTRA